MAQELKITSVEKPEEKIETVEFEIIASEDENSCCVLPSLTLSSLVVALTFAISPRVSVK